MIRAGPLIAVLALCASRPALAYRPFDGTDAAVAERGQLEIELGPVGLLREGSDRFLVLPALIANVGFAEGLELVIEGRHHLLLGAAALAPRSRLVDTALSLKGVVRQGELQESSFVAPPGVDKTVIGTYLVSERGCSTLIMVHRRPLLDQWLAQLSLFLGIEATEIGQIGAGKKAGNGRLDVAMIQSLVRKGKVQDVVANYGQIIVDECHHLPAVSFERVLAEAKARYIVGLMATPQRRDGHHPISEMQLGPVRFAVDPKSQAAQRPFGHRLVVRETGFKTTSDGSPGIQGLYAALAVDEKRNGLILDDVIQSLEERRSPILLTERRDHLEYFAAPLQKFARHLVVLQGGMSAKERCEVKERLAAIPDNEERLVLATGRYIGEGFDDARLDTLFLALPVSWKGTLIQYTGRLHRLHTAKKEVRIFDYVDRDVPMLLRMFEKRLRGYRAIGYARGEAPLGYAEPGDEIVVEYDEDVLREIEERDDLT